MLKNVINEEIQKFLVEHMNGIYDLQDIARLAAKHTGYGDQPEMVKNFETMFRQAYQNGGDKNVVNLFKEATGVDIHVFRTGRYGFTPFVTPQDYDWKTFRESALK